MKERRERQRQRRRGKRGGSETKPKTPPAEGQNNRRAMRPDRADRRWGKQRTRREKRLKGTGMGNIPRGAQVEVTRVGGNVPPLEENEYLPGFSPERVHLLFQEVYGDFPHHNNRAQLDRVIVDDAAWQCAGAGLLPTHRAGTPYHLEWWGAASKKNW